MDIEKLFGPILRKSTRLHLFEETVLPFMSRKLVSQHGSFGQIFALRLQMVIWKAMTR